MLKSLVAFAMLISVALGQPPQGTGRVNKGVGGRESYYSHGGKYLGQSKVNPSKGRTYSDKQGVYSRSYGTKQGERIIPIRKSR